MLRITVEYSGEPLRQQLARACRAAEIPVAVQVLKDMQRRMPARTKSLINRSHVEQGNVVVIPGPYASYLDAGRVMVDENGHGPFPTVNGPRFHKGAVLHATSAPLKISTAVNPNATAHFVDVTMAECGERWREVARKAVLRGL